MTMSAGSPWTGDRVRRAALRTCATLLLIASSAGTGAAQTPAAEPARPATESAPPPAQLSEQPGLITGLGNWVQQGVANMGAGFGTMMGAIRGGAGQAAKNAADAA